jgi:uncharacterized membrane protein
MMGLLIVKWIHVLAAITAVGTNVTYGIWIRQAAKEPDSLPFVLRNISWIDRRLANPGYALLLISGLTMALLIPIPLTTPWLLTAIILYIIAALLGILLYAPTSRSQRHLLQTAGFGAPEYAAVARRGNVLGMLVTLDVLIIVFLMVVKPQLW